MPRVSKYPTCQILGSKSTHIESTLRPKYFMQFMDPLSQSICFAAQLQMNCLSEVQLTWSIYQDSGQLHLYLGPPNSQAPKWGLLLFAATHIIIFATTTIYKDMHMCTHIYTYVHVYVYVYVLLNTYLRISKTLYIYICIHIYT